MKNTAVVQTSDSPQKKNPLADQEVAALESALRDARTRNTGYKINPADLITITVYREENLTRTLRVSQDGGISFPLIGIVSLGGKSVIEAGGLLSEKLSEYLINPQVTVFVKEYANKTIYVLGEIKRPGSQTLPTESQLTVLEAISLAEGFSPVAAKDRTKVIRSKPDGSNETFTIPVSDITEKGQKQKDIPLQPGDVIFVPQSFF